MNSGASGIGENNRLPLTFYKGLATQIESTKAGRDVLFPLDRESNEAESGSSDRPGKSARSIVWGLDFSNGEVDCLHRPCDLSAYLPKTID